MQHVDEGQLHAYLDGELAELGGEPRELERHLGSCPECAARLESVRRLREEGRAFLAGGPARPVAQPPFEEVVARARTLAPTARRPRYLASAVWAASLAVALGAGWLARGLLRESAPERLASVERVETAAPDAVPAPVGAEDFASTSAAAPAEPRSGAIALAEPPTATQRRAEVGAATVSDAVADAAPGPLAGVAMGSAASAPAGEPAVVALEGLVAREEVAMAPPAPPPAAEQSPTAPAGAARARAMRATANGAALAPTDEVRWSATDAAGARQLLGRAPLTVPGLATLAIERGELGGIPAVRVRQALESGGEIALVQTRTSARAEEVVATGYSTGRGADSTPQRAATSPVAAAPGAAPEVGVMTVTRGELSVTATAPLAPDALRALLERLR